MSSLIVQVCNVDAVDMHPNADKMEIATVKGWKTCIGKGQFKAGDKCVYIPPDSVLPAELSDRLGVTKYLQPLAKDVNGNRPAGGRIRVARLRGERSYGLLIGCTDPHWPVGQDVAALLGIRKWEPPQPCTDGAADRPHPAFFRYTDIENFRNFPDVFHAGEEVIFTEKLHGKNTRLGCIRCADADGRDSFQFMAGSHDVRRKEFVTFVKTIRNPITNEPELDDDGEEKTTTVTRRSQFWDCLTEPVRALLQGVSQERHNVILFGEMYGRGQQDMWYGAELGFRAFDLMVDGSYLDFDDKQALFKQYGVEAVPVLYRGPFSKARVEEYVEGPTTMCPADQAGAFKGREGIVITPVKERYDEVLGGAGRVILKAISFAYLERRDGTELH
jgi:RNA ligase (TIGR02306 family)